MRQMRKKIEKNTCVRRFRQNLRTLFVTMVKKGSKDVIAMAKETVYVRAHMMQDTLCAELLGEIDHHTCRPMRKELDELLYLHRPRALIIDLSRVSFMDSSGLGLLMGRVALAESLGTRITVRSPSSRVRRILELSGITRLSSLVLEDGAAAQKKERKEHA